MSQVPEMMTLGVSVRPENTQRLLEEADAQEVPGAVREGVWAAFAVLAEPTRLPCTVRKLLEK